MMTTEVVSTTLKRTVKIRVRDCIGMDNGTIVQDNFRGLELSMASPYWFPKERLAPKSDPVPTGR